MISDKKRFFEVCLLESARHFDVEVEDMMQPKKHRAFSVPRQMAIYVAHRSGIKQHLIAKYCKEMGFRYSKQSIWYCINKVQNKLNKKDAFYKEELSKIKTNVKKVLDKSVA
jgi:chromosomal replication initiation ATPase DnaA